MRRNKSYIVIILSVFTLSSLAGADTVYMKNGEEEKGIVVENYHDRIILSTIDGEKEIKKTDIKDILYDRLEQNLVKLGDFHEQKGNLLKAYTYFKKAYQLNPDYKEAQDRFMHIRAVLLKRPEKQMQDDISRKQSLFKEAGRPYSPRITERFSSTIEERLRNSTGLVLISEDEMPKVNAVLSDSPAQKAGIQKGDIIYSAWGRMTGYLGLNAICEMIVENPAREVLLGIKRKVTIILDAGKERKFGGIGGIGFAVDIKEEGLTITEVRPASAAARQGLAEGDLIALIEGKPTRYMPLSNATTLIDQSCSKGRVELELIREAALWRKEL